MSAAEQARRRALKREARELQRSLSLGLVRSLQFDECPKKWNYGRRGYHCRQQAVSAYASVRRRIGEIDDALKV